MNTRLIKSTRFKGRLWSRINNSEINNSPQPTVMNKTLDFSMK